MKIVEQAKKFSKEKHKGQVDKANEDYYSAHVEVVAKKVANAGYPVEYIVTAYLHDIVEDTEVTTESIEELFGGGISSAVASLSKSKGEDYSKYIERVQKNQISTVVKYYDMEHNSDLSRLEKIREKDLNRKNKYLKYMDILSENMERVNSDLELNDLTSLYHTRMYVQAEYSKLIWKRFNWFLAIEAGLIGLYFTKSVLTHQLMMYAPIIGMSIAILWLIMGQEDQKSAQKHKRKGRQIENIILYNHLDAIEKKKETHTSWRQTNILWGVPLLISIFWICTVCLN